MTPALGRVWLAMLPLIALSNASAAAQGIDGRQEIHATPTPALHSLYVGTVQGQDGRATRLAIRIMGDALRGEIVVGRVLEPAAMPMLGGNFTGVRWEDSLLMTSSDVGREVWWLGRISWFDGIKGSYFVMAGPQRGQSGTWAVEHRQGEMLLPKEARFQGIAAPWDSLPALPSPSTSQPSGLRMASSGSGFIVSRRGDVLTNDHVIDGCRHVRVAPEGLPDVSASVRGRDERLDLALLQAPLVAPIPVAFDRTDGPRLGDDVVAMGYPLQGLLAGGVHVTGGSITATGGIRGDEAVFQISAPVQPGNSGGPLFNRSGLVVGIVVSKLNAVTALRLTGDIPQNVNFAIRGDLAERFLVANGVPPLEREATRNFTTAEIAETSRASTVLVTCWK